MYKNVKIKGNVMTVGEFANFLAVAMKDVSPEIQIFVKMKINFSNPKSQIRFIYSGFLDKITRYVRWNN